MVRVSATNVVVLRMAVWLSSRMTGWRVREAPNVARSAPMNAATEYFSCAMSMEMIALEAQSGMAMVQPASVEK
jgi:hypothetical protein